MSETKTAVEVASIRQSCKKLHLPTVGSQCERLAEQAVKAKQSHVSYLDALLEAEVEERERNVVRRRMHEAHFPKVKALEDFDSRRRRTSRRPRCASSPKANISRAANR